MISIEKLGWMAVLVASAVGCKSTSASAPASACPTRYRDLPADQQKGDATCACPASASGSVWGAGIYTTDSSICGAAVHAGALTGAGNVTVRNTQGCSSYNGSTANGVTSSSWGSYDASFYFPSKGDGKCAAPVAECPATADAITGTELSCTCSSIPPGGSVWGVGTYTSDSSICRAAVHAGAIPASGGTVKVKKVAGCAKYDGADTNGIQTTSWGSHGASFYFDGKGDGHCSG